MTLEEHNIVLEERLNAALEERQTHHKELTSAKFKIDILESAIQELMSFIYKVSMEEEAHCSIKAEELRSKYYNLIKKDK